MKVEILKSQQIDWTKPQVVISKKGKKVMLAVNKESNDSYAFCGTDVDNGEYCENWNKESFKNKSDKRFPIELNLTIESEKELSDLWNRNQIIFWNVLKKLIKENKFYK